MEFKQISFGNVCIEAEGLELRLAFKNNHHSQG